jgi:UDP-N-acetylglucosamine transferase subunit ALG13
MMPFDRLVEAVDAWAIARGRTDVFAQIGDGVYVPKAGEWIRTLSPSEFALALNRASVVVGHAGMGTVLKALEAGRPMVLVPRAASRREVTTDHQLHAATWLSQKPGVRVVVEVDDLAATLDEVLGNLRGPDAVLASTAPVEFIEKIRSLLRG